MACWDFLETRLAVLEEQDLLRVPDDGAARHECERAAAAEGSRMLDASSNDYLGYANDGVSRETNPGTSPGAGASRLIHGTRSIHRELESELSNWMQRDATLLFASGYAANVGVLSSLPQAGDLVLSDALNHASIIDGCRLSRAETRIIPHLDTRALERTLQLESQERRCWVVTESYFSMDGDSPNLSAIREICDAHGSLMIVDEAHALGVFGSEGAGLCRRSGVVPDILVGTFGKALGAQGAFVSSESPVRCWLWNKARSFVYSTASSPILCEYALHNVRRARVDESAREKLAEHSARVRDQLNGAGIAVLAGSHGHIVPILLGDSRRALRVAEQLRAMGILVQAIRPPSVGTGLARIRLTLKSCLSSVDVQRITQAVIQTCARS